MMILKKIDPHHHLWDLSNLKKANIQSSTKETFIGDFRKILKNYLIEDYLRDVRNQNVVKSVVIQSGWDPSNPIEETAYLQSIAAQFGFPHGIVAFADLSDSDVESVLASQRQYPNVRGIRQILSWHKNPDYRGCTKDYIEMPVWQSNFGLLKKYGLSFDMQVFSYQMPGAAELAKRYPDIQVVINHSGMPLLEDEEDIDTWKQNLKLLGLLPNVAIKISGLGMFDHKWTVDSIRPIVRYIIEVFGVERCMFASNYPVDSLYSDYDTIYEAFYLIVEDFEPYEQNMLFMRMLRRYTDCSYRC